LAGVKLSETSLKELKEKPVEFVFVLPDILRLQSRTKRMTIVTLAEAQALHLSGMNISKQQRNERVRMFQQSIQLFEKSIRVNPSSEDLRLMFAKACEEQALLSAEVDAAILLKSVMIYKQTNRIDKIKELVTRLNKSQKQVPVSFLQTCFDLIIYDGIKQQISPASMNFTNFDFAELLAQVKRAKRKSSKRRLFQKKTSSEDLGRSSDGGLNASKSILRRSLGEELSSEEVRRKMSLSGQSISPPSDEVSLASSIEARGSHSYFDAMPISKSSDNTPPSNEPVFSSPRGVTVRKKLKEKDKKKDKNRTSGETPSSPAVRKYSEADVHGRPTEEQLQSSPTRDRAYSEIATRSSPKALLKREEEEFTRRLSEHKAIQNANLYFVAENGGAIVSLNLTRFDTLDDHVISELAVKCANLSTLKLSYASTITDKTLLIIANNCKKLREIYLDGISTITDTGLKELIKRIPTLQSISVSYCKSISNAGLKYLSKLKALTYLDISATLISDANLYSLSSIEDLHLKSTFVDNKSIGIIARYCTRLKSLDISHCLEISDVPAALAALIKGCKNLQMVTMFDLPLSLDEKAMKSLTGLEGITSIAIYGKFEPDTLVKLKQLGLSVIVRSTEYK
jgi:hypothetical protein